MAARLRSLLRSLFPLLLFALIAVALYAFIQLTTPPLNDSSPMHEGSSPSATG